MMTTGMARNSDTTMALAIDDSSVNAKPEIQHIAFDRMIRNPEWMGFCTGLGRIQGLECLVIPSSLHADRNAIVIATPPSRALYNDMTTSTPDDPENAVLDRILRHHHGAGRVEWVKSGECPGFPESQA